MGAGHSCLPGILTVKGAEAFAALAQQKGVRGQEQKKWKKNGSLMSSWHPKRCSLLLNGQGTSVESVVLLADLTGTLDCRFCMSPALFGFVRTFNPTVLSSGTMTNSRLPGMGEQSLEEARMIRAHG